MSEQIKADVADSGWHHCKKTKRINLRNLWGKHNSEESLRGVWGVVIPAFLETIIYTVRDFLPYQDFSLPVKF